ncbi:DODA-type extradiol aromatic ring-opening family dioxygenase, partial [Klebsiella pneumoniae]
PKAVVVISAHWQAPAFTVNAQSAPPLLYDYYGFPEHTYRIAYPAPGDPTLAAQVQTLLADAGLDTATEPQRGLDHGVFIPFKLVYPDAD